MWLRRPSGCNRRLTFHLTTWTYSNGKTLGAPRSLAEVRCTAINCEDCAERFLPGATRKGSEWICFSSFDLPVWRSARAGCVLGKSKVCAAAAPFPRGQAQPTKAFEVDSYDDNGNDGWVTHSARSTGSTRQALMAVGPRSLAPAIPLTWVNGARDGKPSRCSGGTGRGAEGTRIGFPSRPKSATSCCCCCCVFRCCVVVCVCVFVVCVMRDACC